MLPIFYVFVHLSAHQYEQDCQIHGLHIPDPSSPGHLHLCWGWTLSPHPQWERRIHSGHTLLATGGCGFVSRQQCTRNVCTNMNVGFFYCRMTSGRHRRGHHWNTVDDGSCFTMPCPRWPWPKQFFFTSFKSFLNGCCHIYVNQVYVELLVSAYLLSGEVVVYIVSDQAGRRVDCELIVDTFLWSTVRWC